MRDYVFDDVPVALMTDDDLAACLRDGFEIDISDGLADELDVVDRLEIEVLIRSGGLRSEVMA
ncbi:hypothetical protein ATO13_23291 [Stappia sp. 22II-S9-Z10]|nr:hypothetical protein ATO13_23291 [Stappia sp. 22II-S9-Z10]